MSGLSFFEGGYGSLACLLLQGGRADSTEFLHRSFQVLWFRISGFRV